MQSRCSRDRLGARRGACSRDMEVQRDMAQQPATADDSKLLLTRSDRGRRSNACRILGYWLICAGTLGMQYAFGALFVQFLELLHDERGPTALVGSLTIGLQCTLAPFVFALSSRFGFRRVAFFGALSTATGLALSAFATRLWHLFFSYSL